MALEYIGMDSVLFIQITPKLVLVCQKIAIFLPLLLKENYGMLS
jgi:hypothetical protein